MCALVTFSFFIFKQACPVIDLRARGLSVPPQTCWVTDTSLALPPAALASPGGRHTALSVAPTPGRGWPFGREGGDDGGDAGEEGRDDASVWPVSCRRCLQVSLNASFKLASSRVRVSMYT
jgi:hypothetical protein